MLRATSLLLLIYLNTGLSHGMECSFGEKSLWNHLISNSCPGLLDPPSKSFCCLDVENNKSYCCEGHTFALMTTWVLVAVIFVVVTIISLVIFCISCLCCIFYRRHRIRHQGIIYGQIPSVVQITQTPANFPLPIQKIATSSIHKRSLYEANTVQSTLLCLV
ncbi:uncharacterized protein LOC143148250 isoform X2 [Ptiloglossa arizonensis]|uniref:uncharacterized protein LOC143148250 isoform X2 n=1 Tax=Ptiloglossa arizonensis TaxID=3350558 RepID=UPI003F9EEEBA